MKAIIKKVSILFVSLLFVIIVVIPITSHIFIKKSAVTEGEIEMFVQLLEDYKNDTGQYPSTAAGLTALKSNVDNAKNWASDYRAGRRPFPYMPSYTPLVDPWGRPFHYQSPGLHGPYDLYSYGADGSPGGKCANRDFTSWDIKNKNKK